MTISMPGRGINDLDSVGELEQLIASHDVVFLLTDTRESRWLPTLLTTKHRKVGTQVWSVNFYLFYSVNCYDYLRSGKI